MAKKPSDKSKYPSRYSPSGWVSFPQYITELLCEKKARTETDADLPIKFWELPDWNKYYKYQITLANKLVKKYSEKSILKAVKECYKLTSFRSPVLISMIEKNESEPILEKHKEPIDYDFKEEKIQFKEVKKSTKYSKLQDLDDL